MRRPGFKLVFALLVCLLWIPGLAQAQDMTKAQRAEIRRFAYNNSLFTLYHEVAHLLFDQLDLPILGREEDAADNMATWTLLNKRTPESDRALADAAQGWILSGVAYDSGGDESDYAAGHSLDKQRAYQIVCLMVGMDETAFRPIANEYRMERDRQESCYWDYDTVDRAFKGLLGARSNKNGRGTEVIVTYHDAGGRLRAAADAFKSSGVFDQVADELRSNYNLRHPVLFNAQRCGEANAFYDPDTVEVIFCYEMMADFMELYEANMPETVAPVPRQTGAGKEKTSKF
ncbi:DUF4344 domain-containing metallopeptidase [Devosia ginsengisoli]|uniref:DUF4344 domain-containing metallopeptidase n=1 Tax=Devosia ginsengisoli TaxID=400770 RepID=UPI0026E9841F|nr:DUF4344 domain-containing metallopeptidase [Devosia ginsengisoli]MCR6673060.1 DUF4344 domain-containing metallopeptidase [Devosia ginsengisoli]